MPDQPAPAPAPASKPRFVRRPHGFVPPEPALVRRQAEIARLAYQHLGSIEAARGFLNQESDALGGRPLDIAGSSPEGMQRVVDLLATVTEKAAGKGD